jgi:hypothetical protein
MKFDINIDILELQEVLTRIEYAGYQYDVRFMRNDFYRLLKTNILLSNYIEIGLNSNHSDVYTAICLLSKGNLIKYVLPIEDNDNSQFFLINHIAGSSPTDIKFLSKPPSKGGEREYALIGGFRKRLIPSNYFLKHIESSNEIKQGVLEYYKEADYCEAEAKAHEFEDWKFYRDSYGEAYENNRENLWNTD